MTLYIYTGYDWRKMKPEEIEIMDPENVAPLKPSLPMAGDIYEEEEEKMNCDGCER